MSSAPSNTDARMLRPSQVLAEALVDRQEPAQLVNRARQLGYSRSLTTALVAACCKRSQDVLATWGRSDLVSNGHTPQS
jgi:hypothetical protein